MLAGFRESWPLWLDSFDTAWLTFTQAVPSATAFNVKPDVSLYDHSKAVAALSAHFGDGTRKKAERMTMPFAHSRIGSIGMTTSFC